VTEERFQRASAEHPRAETAVLRTFVAVEVGEEVTRRAAEILERLRQVAGSDIKWVDPRNYHLTVKFLGPTRRSDLPRLSEALQELAARVTPFDLEFVGAGAFPSLRRPQVVWLGVIAGQEALAALAGEAEAVCEPLGWPREQKPYRAHLTLGRTRDRSPRRGRKAPARAGSSPEAQASAARLVEGLEAERDASAGLTTVHRLVLMESQLHPHGPTYTVLDSFPFGASGQT
jgi:RNA 2',3'-cyclic 3'-phosphodiesterase